MNSSPNYPDIRLPVRGAPALGLQPQMIWAHFEICDRIGGGSFGEVYKAIDRRSGTTVALKLLLNADYVDPAREARVLVAANTHPAPAPYDVLVAATTSLAPELYEQGVFAGISYIAMQLFPWPTLADRLKSGRLSVARAITLGSALAEQIATLHRLGLVHGDVSPRNILLGNRKAVKLIDFGLATRDSSRSCDISDTVKTIVTAVAGSDLAQQLPAASVQQTSSILRAHFDERLADLLARAWDEPDQRLDAEALSAGLSTWLLARYRHLGWLPLAAICLFGPASALVAAWPLSELDGLYFPYLIIVVFVYAMAWIGLLPLGLASFAVQRVIAGGRRPPLLGRARILEFWATGVSAANPEPEEVVSARTRLAPAWTASMKECSSRVDHSRFRLGATLWSSLDCEAFDAIDDHYGRRVVLVTRADDELAPLRLLPLTEARSRHSAIATHYETGVSAGHRYEIYEAVPGISLVEWLRRDVTTYQVIQIAARIADVAVAALTTPDLEVTPSMLNPSTIFVTPSRRVLVYGFGRCVDEFRASTSDIDRADRRDLHLRRAFVEMLARWILRIPTDSKLVAPSAFEWFWEAGPFLGYHIHRSLRCPHRADSSLRWWRARLSVLSEHQIFASWFLWPATLSSLMAFGAWRVLEGIMGLVIAAVLLAYCITLWFSFFFLLPSWLTRRRLTRNAQSLSAPMWEPTRNDAG